MRSGRKQNILHGCAQNCSSAQFVAPIPYPNPIPSTDPCTTGEWGDNLCWSYVSVIAIAIVIRLLTQSLTCKMGSSIFAAMCRIKFVSTTRASFPSMPSTERKKGEKKKISSWQCLLFLFLVLFFLSIQERYCFLPLVVGTVWVPQYDVNYGLSLNFL